MSFISIISSTAVAFVMCWLVNWRIFGWWQNNTSFANKHTHQPQDFHQHDVPRTGGIGLFFGMAAGFLWIGTPVHPLLLILCLVPAFVAGICEDVSNKGLSPSLRLLITVVSGVLAIWLIDVKLSHTGIYFVDQFVEGNRFFSWFCVSVIIAGAAHSANVIDGFNGLMPGYGILACLPFIWICWQFGDEQMVLVFSVLLGSLIGLFIMNYPHGKIFSGDSGAYLLGVTLSIAALLMLERNPDISPWFPMVVMSYPVGETIFSIIRKRLILGKPAMQPDEYHMHMIVHKLINRHYAQTGTRANTNAMTSPWLWLLTVVPSIGAAIYPTDTKVLIIICFAYASVYICLYVILLMRLLAIRSA